MDIGAIAKHADPPMKFGSESRISLKLLDALTNN